MAAGSTIRHRPDLGGVPLNIQRELEYLRGAVYKLLDTNTGLEARIKALEARPAGAQGPPGPAGLPGPVVSGTTVTSSQPSGSGGGAVIVLFKGQPVVLSPFPFLDNPISGVYMTNLYNFLQTVPGAWDNGCIQVSGVYTWPQVDDLPVSGIVPADWGTYIIVGNKVIHQDAVCVL